MSLQFDIQTFQTDVRLGLSINFHRSVEHHTAFGFQGDVLAGIQPDAATVHHDLIAVTVGQADAFLYVADLDPVLSEEEQGNDLFLLVVLDPYLLAGEDGFCIVIVFCHCIPIEMSLLL